MVQIKAVTLVKSKKTMPKSTMHSSKPNFIITFILIFFNLLMILFPKEITSAAKNGLLLWFNFALPSLLPFIIGTKMLNNAGFAKLIQRPAAPIARLLFNMDGSCIFPIAAGFISGCPIGAKTTCDLYKDGCITRKDAQRLLCFTNNSGPLFILGTVAAGMFGNIKTGCAIMTAHYSVSLATGILLRFWGNSEKKQSKAYKPSAYDPQNNTVNILGDAVTDGMNTILMIGGYIILFSVIIELTAKILSPTGNQALHTISALLLEVTSGCRLASAYPHGAALCAAAISWGGLSIHAQTMGFVKAAGLKMHPYIISRVLQAAAAAAIMPAVCSIYHVSP